MPTAPTVTTRWDSQPAPTSDTERLLTLLFGDNEQAAR